MSLGLIIIGLFLLISSVENTQSTLFANLQKDFTGTNNYFEWMLALLLVGLIGYIPGAKGVSIALLALILVVIFLRQGQGFFSQLSKTAATAGGTGATS